MTAPEYRIATIADFLAVPAEKQAELLRDFGMWLDVVRNQTAVNVTASEALGGAVTLRSDYFRWIDDGIVGCSAVDITAPDGERVARLSVLQSSEGKCP